MGRTKRRRRKLKENEIKSLNNNLDIVDLCKWMSKSEWDNSNKLKIASFPITGRGVQCTTKIRSNNILIEIPFELLITYTTIQNSENFISFLTKTSLKFTIHELLALFLLYENDAKSFWYKYIKSLPDKIDTIWLCLDQEIHLINDKELLFLITEQKDNFNQSWDRVKTLSKYMCPTRVLTRDSYLWAYTIVNTRSVYVDPLKLPENNKLDLNDAPNMALCPFLDMFNHNSTTNTEAQLIWVNGKLNYQLITASEFKKYEQIFISYGPHDNKKLLTQYGFLLNQNQYDCIKFKLKEILNVLKISATSKQYKFICERQLDQDLFVSYTGCSFNMAAVLYVLNNNSNTDWSAKIYTSQFNIEQLSTMYSNVNLLLKLKLSELQLELDSLNNRSGTFTSHFQMYIGYINTQIEFVNDILRTVIKKYVL